MSQTVMITELTYFAGDPGSLGTPTITVEWRGGDNYCIKRRGEVWNGKDWENEPQPSSRGDDFIHRTRFGYLAACSAAATLITELAPGGAV